MVQSVQEGSAKLIMFTTTLNVLNHLNRVSGLKRSTKYCNSLKKGSDGSYHSVTPEIIKQSWRL